MEQLLLKIVPELTLKIVGWLVAVVVALFTLLYRGIWARIKQMELHAQDTRTDLDQLIGAHRATHKEWDGDERRKHSRHGENF